MNNFYEELIISSGGIKGCSLIGALNEFNKIYPIKKIKYLTGCSIGALVSCMLNIGYTLEELNDIMFKINFENFQDLKIINLIEKCGLDEGVKITNFFKAIIMNKDYDYSITYEELYNKTGKILTIVVANITKGIAEYHNIYNTPNYSILLSLRMSLNVPVLFSPIKYNNNYYADGALIDPYPYFCNKNTKKIGFWICQKNDINFFKNNDVKFINELDNSFSYILNLLNIVYTNYLKKYYKKIPKNTIFIKFDYDGLKFDSTIEEKIKMYNFGEKKCKQFCNTLFKKKRKYYLMKKYYYLWKGKIINY